MVLVLALFVIVVGDISINMCRNYGGIILSGESSPSESAGDQFVEKAGKSTGNVENAI